MHRGSLENRDGYIWLLNSVSIVIVDDQLSLIY